MEPFPPFVNTQGTGLTIDMLNAIAGISDLEFKIMTYVSAKYQLKIHKINIIGHPPKNLETPEFYQ
jgi:polar amino acid transport system substrate-binding protein